MIVFAREKDKENSYENMPNTVRPISSDPDYIVSYNKKWVTTSWTYSSTFREPSEITTSRSEAVQVLKIRV